MLGFLVVAPQRFRVDPDARASLGDGDGTTLAAAVAALEPLEAWTPATVEEALRAALVDGLGLKPKLAFTPVRVAVTGRRVSPPLFESLALLGRDVSLDRVRALAAALA
jgi:glutamyl-tRNA synthetase